MMCYQNGYDTYVLPIDIVIDNWGPTLWNTGNASLGSKKFVGPATRANRGVPKSVIWQFLDSFSIETYDDLGIPHFGKPPNVYNL